jgi:hypothetical protein
MDKVKVLIHSNVVATHTSHPLSRAIGCTDSHPNLLRLYKYIVIIESSFKIFFAKVMTPRRAAFRSF